MFMKLGNITIMQYETDIQFAKLILVEDGLFRKTNNLSPRTFDNWADWVFNRSKVNSFKLELLW